MRKLFWVTFAASLVVFCIVQDRVTAEGARQYVALQKAALAGRGRLVTIDEIMQPAIDRSVRLALISSGSVAAVGLTAGLVMRRRTRRTAEEVRYP